MIDHRRYAALLDAVAGAGATLIQIGDDKQLSPVGPGGLWTSTHREAEAHGTAAELRVVRRAREAGEARAWGAIREGRVVEGLTMIRDAGRLQLYDTREQMREAMVAAWWEAGPERGLMMVDTSNEERDRLNQLAQAKRLEAGELGRESVSFGDGRELHVGDRGPCQSLDRSLLGNGLMARVAGEGLLRPDDYPENAIGGRTLNILREFEAMPWQGYEAPEELTWAGTIVITTSEDLSHNEWCGAIWPFDEEQRWLITEAYWAAKGDSGSMLYTDDDDWDETEEG